MSLTFNGTALKKHTHNGFTVKKWTHDGVQVFSSGSTVSYYNGSTLIGTKDFEEGTDVLRPGYSPTKSGYTFYGWSKTNGGSRVTSLKADGNPITLYAVFIVNSITVLTASTKSGTNPNYEITNYNSKYVPNPTYAYASGWYQYTYSSEDTKTMTVYIGEYGKMTVEARGESYGNSTVGDFEGESCLGKTITKTYYTSKTFTMYAKGSHSDSGSWHVAFAGCTSIVLSNPPKWQ